MTSRERNDGISILTDEPCERGKLLDFDRYGTILASIIKNSPPRFSVGIFGGWGTGKTSLMKLVQKKIEEDPNILTVWFNAWKFEREEYLAVIPLLRTIGIALEVFSRNRPTFSPDKVQLLKKSLWSALKAILRSTSISIGAKGIASADIDFSKILESVEMNDIPGGEIKTIYYHAIDFLQDALEKLQESQKDFRIVVFIDDVDRCTPEKGLEVLESIKSFFDMKGFVFVVGMNNESIDFLMQQKFGQETKTKGLGLDYLKKIVQLPFQMPKWTEGDISAYIDSVIKTELQGSEFQLGFTDRPRKLLISAVEHNPRELKRFINHVILAQAVFKKNIESLIAVNALRFRPDWSEFLDFISRDDRGREEFFTAYKMMAQNERALDVFKDQLNLYYPKLFDKTDPLRRFLDNGGAEILGSINSMEEYRRALDTTSVSRPSLSILPGWLQVSSSEGSEMGISIQYTKEEIPKKRPEGRQWYQVTVWIDAPSPLMSDISKVTYHFHPTFRPQFGGKDYVSIISPEKGFMFSFRAYGSFTLGADIEFKDNKVVGMNRFLEITYGPTKVYVKDRNS